MRILVTRAIEQAEKTAVKLSNFGHECVIAPLVSVEYFDDIQIQTEKLAGIAVTSARAIEGLQRQSNFLEICKFPLYCVGDQTASKGKNAGFQQVFSADADVDVLFELIQTNYVTDSGNILYITGVDRTGNLQEKLIQIAIPTELCIIYNTHYQHAFPANVASEINSGNIDAVLIYSKNGCTALVKALKQFSRELLTKITFFSISQNAAEPLKLIENVKVKWPSKPNEDELLNLLN